MTTSHAQSIEAPAYVVTPSADSDDAVIAKAIAILERRIRSGPVFESPAAVKDYARLQLGALDHEVFAVIFVDSQHRLIAFEQMFRGTLGQTSVYPREVVKRALELNAGAVILAHNHPSGSTQQSRADEYLTQTLKTALALVDVRILDHVVVSCEGCRSFAEQGLL